MPVSALIWCLGKYQRQPPPCQPLSPCSHQASEYWDCSAGGGSGRPQLRQPPDQNVRSDFGETARGGLSFCRGSFRDVRFWPKADILSCTAHVRFRGKSGHAFLHCICRLVTQSGHRNATHGTGACSFLRRGYSPRAEYQRRVLISFEDWRRPNLTGRDVMRRRDFIKIIVGSAAAWRLTGKYDSTEEKT
jgi:hypothetical protein